MADIDLVQYTLDNAVIPRLDTIIWMVMIIGLILIVLVILLSFYNYKKIQTQLIDVQEKIKILMENKRL